MFRLVSAGVVVVAGFCGEVSALGCQNGAGQPIAASRDSTGRVSGRVIRTDGTPVRSAVVGLLASGDSTATRDDGRFEFRKVASGPHMLWVHGVGFEPTRVAISLLSTGSRSVTIMVEPALHTLARIVTTARTPSSYADVGLDKRMLAGVGTFITIDQIEARQAGRVTELLQNVRGIHLYANPRSSETLVESSHGDCVSFMLDGVAQVSFSPGDLDGTYSPDEIGAIEIYSVAEKLVGFGGNTRGNLGETCAVIVIWTRSRLGLGGYPADSAPRDTTAIAARSAAFRLRMTSGVAAFPAPACVSPSAIDTTTLNVYAVLQSSAPMKDSAWTEYSDRVSEAFRQAFALPSPVALPVFGYAAPAVTKANWKPNSLAVAPTLSSVIAITLGSTGTLLASSVAATSLSGGADTSILAAVAAAASNHAFPPTPKTASPPDSVRFDLILTTNLPDSSQHAVVVGQISVSEWILTRAATLASGIQPVLEARRSSAGRTPDSATFEFVVDETGKPDALTARAISRAGRVTEPAHMAFVARIAEALPAFRFDPAIVGACPVRQITRQIFAE